MPKHKQLIIDQMLVYWCWKHFYLSRYTFISLTYRRYYRNTKRWGITINTILTNAYLINQCGSNVLGFFSGYQSQCVYLDKIPRPVSLSMTSNWVINVAMVSGGRAMTRNVTIIVLVQWGQLINIIPLHRMGYHEI